MFAVAAKLGWFFLTPSNLLPFLIIVGLLVALTRWRLLGLGLAMLATVSLVTVSLGPVGRWLALPLETRFPQVRYQAIPPVDGIIILGGGLDDRIATARGDQMKLGNAGDRVLAAIALARRLPNIPILYSGGRPIVSDAPEGEAAVFARLAPEHGIDPSRILVENLSRDTFENAILSREILKPAAGSRYLLVTSAWHMPRSVGAFRRQGMDVVPFPVDFRTAGPQDWSRPYLAGSDGLIMTDTMVKEYIGLLAYYLGDRTDALFPAP